MRRVCPCCGKPVRRRRWCSGLCRRKERRFALGRVSSISLGEASILGALLCLLGCGPAPALVSAPVGGAVRWLAPVGAAVAADQPLAVIESSGLEIEVPAVGNVVVLRLCAAGGEVVAPEQALMEVTHEQ